MSSSNAAEILAMAVAGQQNVVPAAGQRRESTFLSLAPATSDSYPTIPPTKSPALKSPVHASTQSANTQAQATATGTASNVDAIDLDLLKTRRSSSLSSDGSSKGRFLKLGPVHFGEGDGKGDWSEEVIAE